MSGKEENYSYRGTLWLTLCFNLPASAELDINILQSVTFKQSLSEAVTQVFSWLLYSAWEVPAFNQLQAAPTSLPPSACPVWNSIVSGTMCKAISVLTSLPNN